MANPAFGRRAKKKQTLREKEGRKKKIPPAHQTISGIWDFPFSFPSFLWGIMCRNVFLRLVPHHPSRNTANETLSHEGFILPPLPFALDAILDKNGEGECWGKGSFSILRNGSLPRAHSAVYYGGRCLAVVATNNGGVLRWNGVRRQMQKNPFINSAPADGLETSGNLIRL